MEVHNSVFASSGFLTPAYYSHHSPPPQELSTLHAWSERDQPSLPYDELPMCCIRFPTPPITPPRVNTPSLHTPQKRTKSVIMKVGQGQNSPQYIPADIVSLEESKVINREVTTSESSSPSNDYICDWFDCGSYFESLESLAAHVTHGHAIASVEDGLYYCRWTGCPRTDRGFNARYKMLVHVRTHTKEKPHQCHLCEKSFSRAENLKIHIRSHSGEKPYICTFEGCRKAYSNSSDRFKHTRTHSMEKPYKCKVDGCEKRYTDPSSLRKHVKTFKHSLQMFESAAVVPVNFPSTSEIVYNPALLENSTHFYQPRYTDREEQSRTYFCMPTAQAAQYYVGIGAEDVCHIKATQLECYYASDRNSVGNTSFWIDDSGPAINNNTEPVVHQSSYELHRDNFGVHVDVEMETPLDLSISKCANV